MNEARETALMMAASINPHGNTVGQLLRDARQIECYLTGQADAIERMKTGPQPPETDPDFAEIETEGDEIDATVVADAINGARRITPDDLYTLAQEQSGKKQPSVIDVLGVFGMSPLITPNDVTRCHNIMRDLLTQAGRSVPPVGLCEDIVRAVIHQFLYGPCE